MQMPTMREHSFLNCDDASSPMFQRHLLNPGRGQTTTKNFSFEIKIKNSPPNGPELENFLAAFTAE